ncbi:GatB/YqeY domain-containing protein [Peredibacter sp. HCB2-198]|uniref:GatB/YqeY domain-containing protein n=1 Tax=Peredibacter starrii TaxID=28202 RepID=A0AAX4HVB6_9BACT|nr:GatB/YqeY domain-containing protein [Peredibacter starrii]WPU67148.1 GatB/YqeY domain-containing protein [Peredibacter starrii]
MTLMEQVNNDIKEAMKAKQQERLDALRMLKAEYIKNNTAAKPTDELSVTVAHAKRLSDSLEMYQAGTEAHDKILKELDVLKAYLPQAMSEAEVVALINDIKAKGAKDMGAIMKELQPQIKGRFDGKRASELVKAAV